MNSFRPRPLSLLLCSLLSLVPGEARSAETTVEPLPQAHAHNDYDHARPLLDALAHGFCSVEADIFLVEGELLVGHDQEELKKGRTLEKLYLAPLKARIEKNDGHLYERELPFTLLIDLKSSAEPTYRALELRLARYQEMLTEFTSSGIKQGAVTVIISGNRPTDFMAAQPRRWAAVDGRLSDLGGSPPVSLMPLISDHWPSHFNWVGRGDFPPQEKKKLLAIVQQTHAAGQRLRFWATPDNRAMWQALAEAKVDLINTDNLSGLQDFLLESLPPAK